MSWHRTNGPGLVQERELPHMTILARRPVNSNLRFVAPTSDYTLGRRMFQAGARLTACITDDQAQGWLDAEDKGFKAFAAEMHSERLPIEIDCKQPIWRGN